MSVFHQHSYPTLKYHSNVIYHLGQELESLRWEIGALTTRYKSSKPLLKIDK